MSLTQLPTMAEVKDRLNLRAEQVKPLYGGAGATADQANTAFEADITARIAEQATVAEQLLLANFTATELAAFDAGQLNAVELAVKLLTVGDLFDSAGQLNDKYQAEAENMTKRGMDLLKALANRQGVTDAELTTAAVTPRTHGGTLRVRYGPYLPNSSW